MAVGITSVGSSINPLASLGKVLPVMSGLALASFDGLFSGLNQLRGGVAMSVAGTPVKQTDFTTLYTINNFLRTNLLEAQDMTFFSVFRVYASGASGNSIVVGNYPGTDTSKPGSSIGMTGSGQVFFQSASYNAGTGLANNQVVLSPLEASMPTTATTGMWRCYAGRVDSTGAVTTAGTRSVFNLTTAAKNDGAIIAGNVRDLRNTGIMNIGRGQGPTQSTVEDKVMMSTLIYNRALSDTEIATMYQYLQGYAQRNAGIVI